MFMRFKIRNFHEELIKAISIAVLTLFVFLNYDGFVGDLGHMSTNTKGKFFQAILLLLDKFGGKYFVFGLFCIPIVTFFYKAHIEFQKYKKEKENLKLSCCFGDKEYRITDILSDKRMNNLVLETIYGKERISEKKISLYRCKACSKQYYLNLENKVFRVFDENIKILLDKWYKYDNSISEEFRKQLKLIGSNPIFDHIVKISGGIDKLNFPCKIQLKDGKIIDFCNLSLYNNTPFLNWNPHHKNIIFLHEVSNIFPSDYSFSKEIRYRIHSNDADDIYFPGWKDIHVYGLRNRQNDKFKIIGPQDFFITKEYIGSDFEVLDKKIELEELNKYPSLESDAYRPHFVVGYINATYKNSELIEVNSNCEK